MRPVLKRARAAATWVLLSLWVGSSLVVGSFLLARHLVPLPRPELADPVLRTALVRQAPKGRWAAVHILYGGCGCSKRVREHLQARGPRTDIQERVVLVGEEADPGPLVARGFATETLRPQQLWQRYHVEAAPLLLISDPAGEVRYAGGYTDRKQGPVIHDTEIIADLLSGRPVQPLPAFGCAVSEELRATIDPLKLSTTGTGP